MSQYTTRLKTTAQIVAAALREADRQARAAEFASRLTVEAWACHRDGQTWIAEGPAGNLLTFAKHPNGEDVEVTSASGGRYTLAMDDDAKWHCDCPDSAKRERAGGCKHVISWHAVKAANAAQRAGK